MIRPPHISPLRCGNKDCTLPEGGRCAREGQFAAPLDECPDLLRLESAGIPTAAAPSTPDGIGWSGRHLVELEVAALLRKTPARTLAVVGLSAAGKTCLLTSFFLQLASGQRQGFPYRFAHSNTLHGWRTLVERAAQWQGQADQIVSRTPKTDHGALLHLVVRPELLTEERVIHLLLSDVPGEWVLALAEHDTPENRARLSFLDHAQTAMVLLDANGLQEEEGPSIAAKTALILRRLKKWSQLRAVALVLTKLDCLSTELQALPPPETRLRSSAWPVAYRGPLKKVLSALSALQEQGATTTVYGVSAFPHDLREGQPRGVMEPFAGALRYLDHRESRFVTMPIQHDMHPFFWLRRWESVP